MELFPDLNTPPQQKTKSKFAAKVAGKENPLKVLHPNKKKSLGINGIMGKFPD